MVTAAATLSFIIFAVSALVFRRRLDAEKESNIFILPQFRTMIPSSNPNNVFTQEKSISFREATEKRLQNM